VNRIQRILIANKTKI